MSPLPNTSLIPAEWSQHHRPTATATQTGRCDISRPGTGPGTTDPDGVWHPPAPTSVYSGPCRITPRPATERVSVSGEQRVTTRDYAVAIEWDAADTREGDLVTVTEATDPRLVGKTLRVVDVRYATEQWERVHVCEDNLTEEAE